MGRYYLSLTINGVLDFIEQLGATSAGTEVQFTILVAITQFQRTGVSPRIRELFTREMLDEVEDLTGATDWLAADSPLWTGAFASEVLPHFYQGHFYRNLAELETQQYADQVEGTLREKPSARRKMRYSNKRQGATQTTKLIVISGSAVAAI